MKRTAASPTPDATAPSRLPGWLRTHALQVAVLGSVVLALAIPGTVALVVERQLAERQARAELQHDVERTADVLAASLTSPMWEFSVDSAEAIVRAMIVDERFVSITVTEAATGRTFVELRRQAGGAGATLSQRRSILREDQPIGTVDVVMTVDPYLEEARARLNRSVLQLSAILLAALGAIVFVLRRMLLAPIRQLEAEAHRIADEELAAPVAARGDNELGRVAQAMEYMRQRLLDTFGELQEKNQLLVEQAVTLESRVNDRTTALSVANSELQQTLHSLQSAQASLVEAEKLASLGRLVAGVAHELNTPIGNAVTVTSTMEDLDQQLAAMLHSGPIRRSSLEELIGRLHDGHEITIRNLHRAAEIIHSFKQVSIDQTTDMRRTFDLKTMIEEVLTSIQPSFKHTPYRIETSLEPGIRMDSFPGPLGQVITNLALNAMIHAFAGRHSGAVQIEAQRCGDDRARIVCRDDGAGMDEATLRKIFDPFFTTKMGQGGTGLGLHIVHTIVTGLLGGSIEVKSQPDQGSEFVIVLPLRAAEPLAS
jgi:signal transduction histidine kinase